MAFTKSRERNLAVGVKKETTEGTDSVPAGGTDDIQLVENANPVSSQVDLIEYRPFAASLTRAPDLIGPYRQQVDLSFWMTGSGSAGVSAVNGYAAIAALWQAAGAKETTVASTSLTYAPATVAQLNTLSGSSPKSGPCSIYAEHGGLLHKITGVWGSLRITATPRTGLVGRFSGFGLYVAPTVSTFSGYTGGTLTGYPVFRGSNILSVTRSGGSAYNPVIQSFMFDTAANVERVEDGNQSTGIKAHVPTDRKPVCELTIAADADGAATLTYAQIQADMVAKTSHAISLAVGSGAGNINTFTASTAYITSVNWGVNAGIRTLTIHYELRATTAEAEWSWAIT